MSHSLIKIFAFVLLLAESLTQTAHATTTTPTTLTIWAALRTDGKPGTGTMQNPYDASTEAKFDAILANILAGNGAQRTILHLGPGVFTLTPVCQAVTTANPGGYTSNIPANLEIIGAGEARTTIRAGIVSTPNATYIMFAQIGIYAGDFFENFTLDCNIQNQTAANITIDGIQDLHVAGQPTHSLASNVHVIDGGNHAGDPGYSEWFAIELLDQTPGSTTEIAHCRVDNYQGNSGCTSLVATTELIGNTVILNNNDPDGLLGNGASGGFQNAFSPASTVTGNVCHQCTNGLYCDVDNQANDNIYGNTFDALYNGVWIYNWSADATINNVSVHNNTIIKSFSSAVILGTAATTAVNSNLSVYGNTIETRVLTGVTSAGTINLAGVQQSSVYGNTFSVLPGTTTLPTSVFMPNCDLGSIAWYNNKMKGVIIPGPAGTLNESLAAAAKAAQ